MAITYHAGRRIQGGTAGTTFSDDFSINDWADLGGLVRVSNDSLHMSGRRDAREGAVYDLGAGNVSDTKWILRAKWNVTRATGEVASGDLLYWGISSSDQNEIGDASQDFIGMGTLVAASGTPRHDYWTQDSDNQNLVTHEATSSHVFTHPVVVETIFVEIIRTSATTYTVELFSDHNYLVSIEKNSQTCNSTIANLRYIKLCGHGGSLATTQFQGDIYDLEFYNNASSVAEANSNFQVGSRWEQTNTQNIFHLDDVGFKLENGNEATNYTSESWYEQLSGETP
tara:strand:- start:86 stop:937 length:852 start_codon:yes stop_codon:yes gene_type:complete